MSENKPRGFWIPQKVDHAFDALVKELNRTPTTREFSRRYEERI